MSEIPPTNQIESPGPPPDERPRRLLRSSEDRVFGGVAGGLAQYFNLDPILFRIGFAVTGLVGIGLIAYLALYIFVPADDGWGNPVPARDRNRIIAGAAMLCLLFVIPGGSFPLFDSGWWWGIFGLLFWLAIIGGAGYGIYRLIRPSQDRELTLGRLLMLIALGLVLICVAGLLAVSSAWATAVGGGAIVAIVIVLTGVLLAVSAFFRPARWLIVIALALILPMAAVEASGLELSGGYGDRTYTPRSVEELAAKDYEMSAGQLTIDLREMDWQRDTVVDLTAKVGLGRLAVVVPERVCVSGDAHAGLGAINLRGDTTAGIAVNNEVETRLDTGPALKLKARTEVGAIEVATTMPSGAGYGPDRSGRGFSTPQPEQPERCFTEPDGGAPGSRDEDGRGPGRQDRDGRDR